MVSSILESSIFISFTIIFYKLGDTALFTGNFLQVLPLNFQARFRPGPARPVGPARMPGPPGLKIQARPGPLGSARLAATSILDYIDRVNLKTPCW